MKSNGLLLPLVINQTVLMEVLPLILLLLLLWAGVTAQKVCTNKTVTANAICMLMVCQLSGLKTTTDVKFLLNPTALIKIDSMKTPITA